MIHGQYFSSTQATILLTNLVTSLCNLQAKKIDHSVTRTKRADARFYVTQECRLLLDSNFRCHSPVFSAMPAKRPKSGHKKLPLYALDCLCKIEADKWTALSHSHLPKEVKYGKQNTINVKIVECTSLSNGDRVDDLRNPSIASITETLYTSTRDTMWCKMQHQQH